MIKVHDRNRCDLIEEKVYGGDFIRWAYGSACGRALINRTWFQTGLSKLAGFYYDSAQSARGIPAFIRDYSIDMDEYVTPPGGFSSFNDFFVREFRPGLRPFPSDPVSLGAPAEGRLSVFEIHGGRCPLVIKGAAANVSELLGSLRDLAPKEGHAWVFRLCPVDYHRFHFPDAGRVSAQSRVAGLLHSVNPIAQAAVPELFFRNERHVTILDSEVFGSMAIIEIGAICVGLIHQSFDPERPVARGQEKGYFKFGASTVVLVTDAASVRPHSDLVARSSTEGIESLVRLGEVIGSRP